VRWTEVGRALLRNINVFRLVPRLLELQEENAELRRSNLELQEKLQKARRQAGTRLSPRGYRYQDGDETPICATCFETKQLPVTLTPPQPWHGGVRRVCPVCGRIYWDEPPKPAPSTSVRQGRRRR